MKIHHGNIKHQLHFAGLSLRIQYVVWLPAVVSSHASRVRHIAGGCGLSFGEFIACSRLVVHAAIFC